MKDKNKSKKSKSKAHSKVGLLFFAIGIVNLLLNKNE